MKLSSTYSWLFDSFDFIQVRFDEPHELLDLELLEGLRGFALVNVAVLDVILDYSAHGGVFLWQEVHSVSPIFHLLKEIEKNIEIFVIF